MRKTGNRLLLVIILIAMIAMVGCGSEGDSYKKAKDVPKKGDEITATDYSDPDNWLITSEPKLPVDVFILYPTTYMPDDDDGIVADITNEGMREGANDFVDFKARAFYNSGNFFAPYYRQLDASFILSKSPEEVVEYIGGIPATDATAAFDYYIKNYNDGRPFILVSHSQGSSVFKELLFTYFKDNPELLDRMIAAYLIGYSFTQEDLDNNPHLKFAESADDLGVIISYNTVAPDFEGNLATLLPGSIAINPITWTRDETEVSATYSRGSYINQGNGYEKLMNLADAKVDKEKGVVICSSADPDIFGMSELASDFFGRGSFHSNDISLYYFDLMANSENRVTEYFKDK